MERLMNKESGDNIHTGGLSGRNHKTSIATLNNDL